MMPDKGRPGSGLDENELDTETGTRSREWVTTGNANTENNLSVVTLFDCLSPENLQQLETKCHWLQFKPGSIIVERGDRNSDVYFLLEGEVQVLSFSDSGRAVAFAGLRKGGYFGEIAAIDNKPRSATVVARTDCRVARITGDEFIDLVTAYPPITILLLNKLAGIIRTTDEKIIDLSVLGAEQRICVELLRRAKPNPASGSGEFEIYPVPTQKALSREVGVTRETVARIFGHLTSEGIIHRKSNVLYVLNKQKMEDIALATKSMK